LKFSYNWLRELVDGLELAPFELEKLITMKTAECEGLEPVGLLLEGACAARIVSVEPISGGHNVKAVVDTGDSGMKTVVCGAPNCRPGVVSVYAPIGKKVIQGVESVGMLASAAELGINDDAAGIIELDLPVGAPLPGCRPDSIIEIDNKSITHRPDLWGHLGMAREVAAINRKPVCDPVDLRLVPRGPAAVKVSIENLDLCPRYSALVFENVTVRPSPPWLQYRLRSMGLNPINNIVDFTNLVMAELAQPTHAFDRSLLTGDTISIRPARAGESITALNEERYDLDPGNLVIADGKGPVAIAGVIGGQDTAISERTTSIVLESACFNAASVRRTSTRLKLRTDASMRFEKSQDPENTVRAIARAMALLPELSPGIRAVGGIADQCKPWAAAAPIRLPLDWLNMKLGRAVEAAEVRDILERLAFEVSQPEPRIFRVTAPSWRATKDINEKDDLVEEVGRMIGYDTIVPTPPAVLASVPPLNEERVFEREVRSLFRALGFSEVYNYSFVSEEAAAAFGWRREDHVEVANPIASDQTLLRLSLLPGIRKNILENSKHFDTFRIFEIGREIRKRPHGLPEETPHLAAAIYAKDNGRAGLFELKHAAECLLAGVEVRPAAALSHEHTARAAEIVWQEEVIGRLAEMHPRLVEQGRAAVLDIDLKLIRSLRQPPGKYSPFRRYPGSAFDLSVVADEREPVAEIQRKLAGFAGPMLESIEFVRQYAGPPLAEGKKSVSFRLMAGSPQRTLSLEEVGGIRARIIEQMQALGYELRV
jgi:phenylalanyl-tRNA synthetase beta chain